ncbi:MAG TPA: tellurite resistance TerB C-terminal domain-containing protein, partial [Anaerovoracaceae bacterium]|nr:tellurite resistance TerB C-terminal domain-containing protein [Anaerovoracaceae bacterium]
INTVTHKALGKLKKAGLSLESIINDEVMEFYREATRTVVKVDPSALSVIRQEALATQEKLIVSEQEDQVSPVFTSPNLSSTIQQQMPSSGNETATMSDTWEGLKSILTEVERKALSILLYNEEGIKEFADGCGIMLEVLVDGINEKAMDYIGDNLMDEEFILYEDYKNQVKEMVGL